MSQRRSVGVFTVGALLLSLVSGCAVMTEGELCAARGGVYSAQSQICDDSAQRELERRRCEAHGNVYWPAQRYCERQSGI